MMPGSSFLPTGEDRRSANLPLAGSAFCTKGDSMASLTDAGIFYRGPLDPKRKCVRTGRMAPRDAERLAGKLTKLEVAAKHGQGLDAELTAFAAKLSDDFYATLAAVGLLPKREQERPASQLQSAIRQILYGELRDADTGEFIRPATLNDQQAARSSPDGDFPSDGRTVRVNGGNRSKKPATAVHDDHVLDNLTDFFGADRDPATITAGDADEFRQWMIGEGYANATIARRLLNCRAFFKALARRNIVTANPFDGVTHTKHGGEARMQFIARETVDKVMAQADTTWQTIIALARYGGLRCPNEVLSLRWKDIDWQEAEMTVTSHKTARHAGKDKRTIPIFHELRPYLEAARDAAESGAEYVIGRGYLEAAQSKDGWKNCNLRTQFRRLIERAGVAPWPRIFQNLRASRETELLDKFPIQTVTAWLGNTPAVALKHYAMVRDEHFAAAVGERYQKRYQHGPPEGLIETQPTEATPENAAENNNLPHGAAACSLNNGHTKIRTSDLVVISDAL